MRTYYCSTLQGRVVHETRDHLAKDRTFPTRVTTLCGAVLERAFYWQPNLNRPLCQFCLRKETEEDTLEAKAEALRQAKEKGIDPFPEVL